jgi:hypothetical protein
MNQSKQEQIRHEREKAWVGDAVLALFARRFVLEQRGCMDAVWFTHLTSNGFLSALGNPTSVEAGIGHIFEEEGLDAAFAWMEVNLVPLFLKQINKKK